MPELSKIKVITRYYYIPNQIFSLQSYHLLLNENFLPEYFLRVRHKALPAKFSMKWLPFWVDAYVRNMSGSLKSEGRIVLLLDNKAVFIPNLHPWETCMSLIPWSSWKSGWQSKPRHGKPWWTSTNPKIISWHESFPDENKRIKLTYY